MCTMHTWKVTWAFLLSQLKRCKNDKTPLFDRVYGQIVTATFLWTTVYSSVSTVITKLVFLYEGGLELQSAGTDGEAP